MNARTLRNALIAAGLALAVPLAAQARPMMEGKGYCDRPMQMKSMRDGQGGHDGMRHGMRGLNLSEEQRDKLFELRHAQAPVMREHAKTARAAQRELRDLAGAETFDAQRAKTLAEASAQARSEMAQLRARNQHAVLQILTPEQRQKWQDRAGRFGKGERDGKGGEGYRPRQG